MSGLLDYFAAEKQGAALIAGLGAVSAALTGLATERPSRQATRRNMLAIGIGMVLAPCVAWARPDFPIDDATRGAVVGASPQ